MLSIVDINCDSSIPRKQKLIEFLKWIVSNFRKSLVAIIYAIVLFGNQPIRRMMKFKKSQNAEVKRHSVGNMTWDLYFMKQFFKNWTEKEKNEEYLFASDDRALCKLLRVAIDVQKADNFSPIKDMINHIEYEEVTKLRDSNCDTSKRVYNSPEWGENIGLN